MRGWLLASSIVVSTAGLVSAQLVINEFMAENDSTAEDPDEPGRFEDWIELYNRGDVAVDLGGMHLTDDMENQTKWRVPSGVTIAAGAYLVFWADDDDEQGDTHTNFKLSAEGEEIGLYDTDGATLIDSVVFGLQDVDVSFGRSPDAGDAWCPMHQPTPGGPNSSCRSARPEFSRPGGTFTSDFKLEITSPSPDADIYFTLDGTEPDEASSTKVTEPLDIRSSVWVRARVYAPGLLPSPVASEVYLKLDSDIQNFDSNLPVVVIDTFGFNIDAEWNPGRPRPFRPVMAVFVDTKEDTGRAAVTGAPDFAGYGGMHVRGQSTASYPKKQYAFETWDEQNEDKNVSLLGFPEESDWVLHAPYSDKTLMRNYLMYMWSNRIGRYAVRGRFVEVFVNRSGDVSASDYVGVYVFMERITRDNNRVDIEALVPADDREPEITGGYLLKKDWYGGESNFATNTYRDRLIYVEPKPEEITAAQKAWIKGYFDAFESALSGDHFQDPENGYAKYIDVGSFVDHHILVETARNVDGYVLSTYLYKDRGGKINMGPIWDYNGALGGANYFCSFETDGWHYEFDESQCGGGGERFPADNPNAYHWYARIFEDPEFLKTYADRWYEIRGDSFATERMLQDIDDTVDLLTDRGAPDNPVKRNFTRWNILNTYVWPNYFVRGTYEQHVGWMRTWLTGRLEWMDHAVAEDYAAAPELSHPGGPVSENFELSISTRSGEIYFTLNGPDPRAEDGSAAPEAVLYNRPIVITENTRVRARSRFGEGQWSRLVEASYTTDALPLVVTEIMYDPPRYPQDTHTFRSHYEFLEFKNIGDRTVDLDGVRVMRESSTGGFLLRFDFTGRENTTLKAGEYVVIVRNVDAFRDRYGDSPRVAGAYESTLSNRGDTIVVLGSLDEPLVHFDYDDTWYPSTNGDGHSLVIRDPTAPSETWSQAESWRPSAEIGGSPGRADTAPEEGFQLPGDISQDGRLNITDAVNLLRHLFLGQPELLPCAEGTAEDAANIALLDVTADGAINLTDAIRILHYLFKASAGPVQGTDCRPIAGCRNICAP